MRPPLRSGKEDKYPHISHMSFVLGRWSLAMFELSYSTQTTVITKKKSAYGGLFQINMTRNK